MCHGPPWEDSLSKLPYLLEFRSCSSNQIHALVEPRVNGVDTGGISARTIINEPKRI